MKKQKVSYTLQDGEVLSGKEVYRRNNTVIIELGPKHELVLSPDDVFETEQEAINEVIDNDIRYAEKTISLISDELDDIEHNIRQLFTSQSLLEKSFDRLERSLLTRMSKLEARKWWQ